MATTDQVRSWYPEVVTNHAQRGTPGYTPTCSPTTKAIRALFPREGGGDYSLWIHPKTKEAWRAYVQTMRHYGETVPSAGGTHNCRNIANTNWPSLHAYCVALDLPPNSRKGAGFQAAILKIKTNSGATVFKNLASINDRMHDQIDCSPAALATGINWTTVPGGAPPAPVPVPPPTGGDDVVTKLPVVKRGQTGTHVAKVQALLATEGAIASNTFDANHKPDGIFGPGTEAAVKSFQTSKGLTADGIVGENTWSKLLGV